MTWLVEDPVTILMVGIAACALLMVIFVQSRCMAVLVAMLGVLLLTVILLAVEWLVVTEVEKIENRLEAAAEALESNDLGRILSHLWPNAEPLRRRVETYLPHVEVTKVRLGDPEITISQLTQPPSARAKFIGRIDGKVRRGDVIRDKSVLRVTVEFRSEGQRWLISDCEIDGF